MDPPSKEKRSEAYIFAVLAFVCTVIKAQADLQHLWFGRRAATRIRCALMAAIYDKALKRKDFSGVVTPNDDEKKDKKSDSKPKAGADVGKIVNLMAADSNRVRILIFW